MKVKNTLLDIMILTLRVYNGYIIVAMAMDLHCSQAP